MRASRPIVTSALPSSRISSATGTHRAASLDAPWRCGENALPPCRTDFGPFAKTAGGGLAPPPGGPRNMQKKMRKEKTAAGPANHAAGLRTPLAWLRGEGGLIETHKKSDPATANTR